MANTLQRQMLVDERSAGQLSDIVEKIIILQGQARGVVAIDVQRTFWEKVTLIHAACGKETANLKTERMSRHWYDLHMLMTGGPVDLGSALTDQTLLREVVALKNIFYYAGSANYERCLEGGLLLEPEQELFDRIAAEYEAMRDMNLVAGEPPEFEVIIGTINDIQSAVNNHFG